VDSDGGMRASDSDRERVVDILRGAYTEGRLTLEEFDERTTAAYAARTWSQLRELTGDLPVEVNLRRPPGSTVEPPPARDRGAAQPLPGATPPVPAGRPGFFPVLPFVILFIVLAGSAHTAALAVLPAIVILMVWLRVSGRHHRDHRPPGGFPPGPGSGRA
jgi:DUF1707 SHOCT-like domain